MSIKSRLQAMSERKKIQKAAYKARKAELEEEYKLTRAEKDEKLKEIAARRGIKGADWKKRLKTSVGDAVYKRLGDAWELREFKQAAYYARKGEIDVKKREEKIEAAKRRGLAKAERGSASKVIARGVVSGGRSALRGGKTALKEGGKAWSRWEKYYYRDAPKKATKPKKKATSKAAKPGTPKRSVTYRKFNGERFKRVALKRLKSEAVAKRKTLVAGGNKARVVKVDGMWEVYSRKG